MVPWLLKISPELCCFASGSLRRIARACSSLPTYTHTCRVGQCEVIQSRANLLAADQQVHRYCGHNVAAHLMMVALTVGGVMCTFSLPPTSRRTVAVNLESFFNTCGGCFSMMNVLVTRQRKSVHQSACVSYRSLHLRACESYWLLHQRACVSY